MSTLRLRRPDDWHVHLRDGSALASVIEFTAARFGRAIVMPNLQPAITSTALARAYRDRITAALPAKPTFAPLMTLYLTDATPPAEIDLAIASGIIYGVKMYPAGATTHSGAGVTDIRRVYPTLARMEELGMRFLIHGETPSADVDVFDREAHFIDSVLAPLLERFPKLRIVLEHITTAIAVDFVWSSTRCSRDHHAPALAAQQKCAFYRGIRPHYYCLPILKRERDRAALVEAATGGNPRFFLGTDSAPHARSTKETACGCAGMFTAHAAIELYAEVFEGAGRLDRLQGFASEFGPDFYGLPRHDEFITLVKEPWVAPASYDFGEDTLVPYRAGESIAWRLAAATP